MHIRLQKHEKGRTFSLSTKPSSAYWGLLGLVLFCCSISAWLYIDRTFKIRHAWVAFPVLMLLGIKFLGWFHRTFFQWQVTVSKERGVAARSGLRRWTISKAAIQDMWLTYDEYSSRDGPTTYSSMIVCQTNLPENSKYLIGEEGRAIVLEWDEESWDDEQAELWGLIESELKSMGYYQKAEELKEKEILYAGRDKFSDQIPDLPGNYEDAEWCKDTDAVFGTDTRKGVEGVLTVYEQDMCDPEGGSLLLWVFVGISAIVLALGIGNMLIGGENAKHVLLGCVIGAVFPLLLGLWFWASDRGFFLSSKEKEIRGRIREHAWTYGLFLTPHEILLRQWNATWIFPRESVKGATLFVRQGWQKKYTACINYINADGYDDSIRLELPLELHANARMALINAWKESQEEAVEALAILRGDDSTRQYELICKYGDE